VIFDFDAPAANVHDISSWGEPIPYDIMAGHIVIPCHATTVGDNAIDIDFIAGDQSLNRNPDFYYTLFVPARAATALPCFDQPNLKATYRLTLTTPASWTAVANAPLLSREPDGDRMVHQFADTQPLSTYLFSFAAGRFQTERMERCGRVMRMYHRETDAEKVSRNREAIFDLHATALDWLEQYTGIPYPFDKFDFVLIPAFQYGGMEHPGAILYRQSLLLLDESATKNDMLVRARLIAHETAHMWFGDLVTMNWFDDVWTKEAYVNLMAAKIVNPSFPEIDHDQNVFLHHYPTAYEVDRTAGANPIRQPLDNLKDAGTLYGAIIYNKAPIVMRQLERIMGETAFRDGMRAYLSRFSYGTATWYDLITILDEHSSEDLPSWSRIWVEEPNRPTIRATFSDSSGRIDGFRLDQIDPANRGRVWNQQLRLLLGWRDSTWVTSVHLRAPSVAVEGAVGFPLPEYVLASADGIGYGFFELDSTSQRFLLRHLPTIESAIVRSAAWVTLWDALLEGQMDPLQLIELALVALPSEDSELNIQCSLGYLTTAYWRYLSAERRSTVAPDVERCLWDLMDLAPTRSVKAANWYGLQSVAITDEGIQRLESIWQGHTTARGLPLSEQDYIALAQALAVRGVPDATGILDEQAQRIRNPDRKMQFEFVRPALSANPVERDEFFASLRDSRNREHEPWVLRALVLLHHPLRAQRVERYIRPSLDLLEEIQQTGSVFFPKSWLDRTLSGHNSEAAAAAVLTFLDDHPDYPERLRLKILQSADPVFRAARIVHGSLCVPH